MIVAEQSEQTICSNAEPRLLFITQIELMWPRLRTSCDHRAPHWSFHLQTSPPGLINLINYDIDTMELRYLC